MKCHACRAPVNILDTNCSRCGASLSFLDREKQPDLQSDSLLEATEQAIERELLQMEQELTASIDGAETRTGTSQGRYHVNRLDALTLSEHTLLQTGGDVNLVTSVEEIMQIGAFAMRSPHVQNNLLYRQRAGTTHLWFKVEDPTVNAFATEGKLSDIEADPPFIVLYGGLANTVRLASLGLACDQVTGTGTSRRLFIKVIRTIGETIVNNRSCLDLESAGDIFTASGLETCCQKDEIIRRARSYCAAMHMNVIGHELGHIALGHTLLTGEKSDEISRNQEREADSFAASVASGSPFSDYIVAGGIFWWVIFTWVAAVADSGRVTTHPHSRERLMDYIRANQDQAAAIGLDEKIIQDFLP